MEIQSAFASGFQGVQRGSELVTDATVNINRQTTSAREPVVIPETVRPSAPSLEQNLIQLVQGEQLAAANVRSIQTADAMLGAIIDVRV